MKQLLTGHRTAAPTPSPGARAASSRWEMPWTSPRCACKRLAGLISAHRTSYHRGGLQECEVDAGAGPSQRPPVPLTSLVNRPPVLWWNGRALGAPSQPAAAAGSPHGRRTPPAARGGADGLPASGAGVTAARDTRRLCERLPGPAAQGWVGVVRVGSCGRGGRQSLQGTQCERACMRHASCDASAGVGQSACIKAPCTRVQITARPCAGPHPRACLPLWPQWMTGTICMRPPLFSTSGGWLPLDNFLVLSTWHSAAVCSNLCGAWLCWSAAVCLALPCWPPALCTDYL